MTLVAATHDDLACEAPSALEVIVARDPGRWRRWNVNGMHWPVACRFGPIAGL